MYLDIGSANNFAPHWIACSLFCEWNSSKFRGLLNKLVQTYKSSWYKLLLPLIFGMMLIMLQHELFHPRLCILLLSLLFLKFTFFFRVFGIIFSSTTSSSFSPTWDHPLLGYLFFNLSRKVFSQPSWFVRSPFPLSLLQNYNRLK